MVTKTKNDVYQCHVTVNLHVELFPRSLVTMATVLKSGVYHSHVLFNSVSVCSSLFMRTPVTMVTK